MEVSVFSNVSAIVLAGVHSSQRYLCHLQETVGYLRRFPQVSELIVTWSDGFYPPSQRRLSSRSHRCPSMVLLSTFDSRSGSLSVLPMISRCLTRLNSNMSAIRIPAFTAENHSIASAFPLDVAVVACHLDFHSTGYVLPFCPVNTINLPPSLRGEAKLESVYHLGGNYYSFDALLFLE